MRCVGDVMKVHEINPLEDPRWEEFIASHPRASVFHSRSWIAALRRAYGYRPIAFTVSAPGEELKSAILFCKVESWLTGHRLVSLPFSDHCEPLVDDAEDLQLYMGILAKQTQSKGVRYIEIRPRLSHHWAGNAFYAHENYCFHELDLSRDLDTLFRSFHKDSTQRKIRKAEREGLTVEEGRSDTLLDQFYRLQLLTRRRHGVPPQPMFWFTHLIDCMGDGLTIRVASKERQPVAAILTLRFKETVTYKYGCSDQTFNNLGATHLLFWRTIQEAVSSGLRYLDLGRSDTDNTGLITFKDRWGAGRSTLTYLRHPEPRVSRHGGGWRSQLTRFFCTRAPDRLLSAAGEFLYKHVG
jgi:lipid II:glycine glycyltransferase (peptidoglycan interpeptide bridge formation enzyme)